MMKLKEMINELCPNGVEFKKFGEIAQISRGASPRPIKNFITTNENGVNWVKIGDVAIGSKYITGTNEKITQEGAKKSRAVHKGDFILSNSMSFGRPYIMKIDGCIHDGWLSISEFEEFLISDFLYYVLVSAEIQNEMRKRASFGGAVQNLNADIVRELMLPVPPLEVQREIVQILDKFTFLQAELTAELSARKKQYEYYKSSLFDFDESVPTIKIGDFTRVFSASRVHKSDWKSEGVPFWRSSDLISFYNGVENSRGKVYISQELYEKLSAKSGKIEENDILVTGGGTIGIPYIVPSNDPFYVKDADLLCIKKNDVVMTKYLYHYFLSQEFKDYLMGITHDATIAHYTISQIKDTPIPVPSIDKQKKIVEILDKFEDLTKNISVGLPAEIEARNKQYEYYRDKLLTFDKAV